MAMTEGRVQYALDSLRPKNCYAARDCAVANSLAIYWQQQRVEVFGIDRIHGFIHHHRCSPIFLIPSFYIAALERDHFGQGTGLVQGASRLK
jgi:hypothetical protein